MTAATSMTDSIDQSKENNKWISANMSDLRDDYGGEYIAVRDSDVIAHEESEDRILEELEEMNIDFSKVTVTFVYESGQKILR